MYIFFFFCGFSFYTIELNTLWIKKFFFFFFLQMTISKVVWCCKVSKIVYAVL